MKKGKTYEPRDPEARYWFRRFNLKQTRITRILTGQHCEWLRHCDSDSERRLMLGISEKVSQ